MAVEAGGPASVALNNNVLSDFLSTQRHRSVQNHLLDTKIYATVGENEVFHIRPSTIHFQGFQAGGKYIRKLRIINASSECQRMHIIPPSTDQFKIKYKKIDSLVPGMYLEATVEFTPSENRYHCDCIRIHTKAVSNLIIPIHAYLVMNVAASFPSQINFKPTLVGQTTVKRIPIQNDSAADFDFNIGFVQKHPAFEVKPTSGIIIAKKHLDIIVSYTPQEYCTACAKIQIIVSQFNSQPFFCVLTGSSEPGLAKKLKLKEMEKSPTGLLPELRVQSPLERLRSKKQLDTTKGKSQRIMENEEKEIIKDGIRFPKNLGNPSAVAYVLAQQAGKMKAKELRDAVKMEANNIPNTKQMKEAIFEHILNKNVTEEQMNQLRWCVKLGEDTISDAYQRKILNERQKTISAYKIQRGDPNYDDEYDRSATCNTDCRIRRHANQQTDDVPLFDLYLNDEWFQRHMVSKKFIQAARKVIIRSRALRNLKSLQGHLDMWRQGNFISAANTKPKAETNKERLIVENMCTEFDPSKIQSFAFPEYKDPLLKDDMAVDSLGLLPVTPTHLIVRTKVQMYNLKVPQQYKLLSYDRHLFTSAVYRHVPKKLARPLRTGAESEITQAVPQSSTPTISSLIKLIDNDDEIYDESTTQLTIPSYFLEDKTYHPLHIFNPIPGVQAHPEPLPYSEVDEDYRLCPLPRSGPGKLDRKDVIPGVMTWKKFASQGSMVMNGPSLSNVYVPRWTDPFSEELCPLEVPSLLQSLPDDDVMECEDEGDIDTVITVPTMEMLEAEFVMKDQLKSQNDDSIDNCNTFPLSLTLPANNNPQSKLGVVNREKLVSDLDMYLRKRQDNLGGRIKSRIQTIQENWKLT